MSDFAVAMVISTFRHLAWCIGAATLPGSGPGSTSDERTAAFAACHGLATAQSHNLRGHVLGLVGMGNIGQNIAAKLGCIAFGMQIHYYDVVRKPAALEQELHATYHASLSNLFAVSDCVVLCTPASTDGQPLITRETLAQMKSGARFVNVARGSLVDEEALADALEADGKEEGGSGRLSAAALDVHATEPHVHPRLLKLATLSATATTPIPARVMLTCHNAGGTVETHIGFEELSMRNIMAVLDGGKAITPVNLHHLKV